MKNQTIEKLLPAYFEGTLGDTEREKVDTWRKSAKGNQQIFADSLKAWEGIEHLRMMKKYNADEALREVHAKITSNGRTMFINALQKVAAVLILPLIVATIYFVVKTPAPVSETHQTVWHTIKTPAGIRSEFILPDGTKVYLNSKTSLSYPVAFEDTYREIILKGEAYFEVAEDKTQPFIVNTGKINIEVTGTEFKASNYPNEQLTEIVLVSGGVNLLQTGNLHNGLPLTSIKRGEKASFDVKSNKIYIETVDVEKYISWKDGILMFRDDSMQEVVRRLNRWFNVDIQLTGNDLSNYVYTATFEDESLMQILDLLKISAPIDYKIKKREQKADNTFSKMEIEIIQK